MLPAGSLSHWEELTGLMQESRESAGAVAMVVPSGDAGVDDKMFVFVGGGRPHAGGDDYSSTIEKARVLGQGALGEWVIEAETLNTERAFFPLLTTKNRDETFIPEIPLHGKSATRGTVPTEPIFLFAVAGDDIWDEQGGSDNTGIGSIEAALVTLPDGVLEEWNLQTHDLVGGRETYAHDGVLIDDFLFCLPGADQEAIADEPTPLSSNTSRFPIDVFASDLLYVIWNNYMASNASWATDRSYYDIVRVNGYVFVMGGNDGFGPISSVESIPQ